MLRPYPFATLLAAVMHLAGLIGFALGYGDLFSLLTPFNLIVMLGLLLWTAPARTKLFYGFLLACCLTGLITEMIGVNTALLFGHYSYGSAFGPKILGVPFLIGVNWFVVVYASAILAVQFRKWINNISSNHGKLVYAQWLGLSIAVDGALIATLFDFIMEPAAIRLGFWQWEGGHIPLLNYISWFGISFLLLLLFKQDKFKAHPFAIHLLIIQTVFFLSLRAFF